MANEITVNGTLAMTNGSLLDIDRTILNLKVNMAGTNYHQGTQSFTTSESAIAKGAIGTLGWCFFKNTDPTNTFFWRSGTGATNTMQALPGETCGPFRSATSTPFGIAGAGTVQVEFLLIEA